MATYEIDTSNSARLDWNATGDARILQNIRNLLRTFRYDVGYDRTRGIDPKVLDKPVNEAAMLYISEAYRVVELYEPRAKLQDVKFTGVDDEGNMQFQAVVEI